MVTQEDLGNRRHISHTAQLSQGTVWRMDAAHLVPTQHGSLSSSLMRVGINGAQGSCRRSCFGTVHGHAELQTASKCSREGYAADHRRLAEWHEAEGAMTRAHQEVLLQIPLASKPHFVQHLGGVLHEGDIPREGPPDSPNLDVEQLCLQTHTQHHTPPRVQSFNFDPQLAMRVCRSLLFLRSSSSPDAQKLLGWAGEL